MPPFDHELAWHAGNGFREPKDIAAELIEQLRSATDELARSDALSDIGKSHLSLAVSDTVEVYRLLSLFIDNEAPNEEIRWRFQFRLARLMDNLMTIGSFRSVSENFKNASSIHSFLIAQDKNAEAAEKKANLLRHIQDQAAAMGLRISKSEKFARIVQPGVCRRAGVPLDAEGYQWPAIKRAIPKPAIKKDHA